MKKIIILSVLFALSATVTAHAQTDTMSYQSVFGESSATWYIINYFNAGINTEIRQVLTNDTTTIDGQNYKTCEDVGYREFTDSWHTETQYLREDSTHAKLFLRLRHNSLLSPELLIMDLNLNVGDTLDTSGWSSIPLPNYYELLSVPTIIIDSVYYIAGRKILRTNHIFSGHSYYGHYDTLMFIEGVGPSFGPLHIRQSSSCLISCYHRDDSIVYHGPGYDRYHRCDYFAIIGIEDVQTLCNDIQLYPNPTRSTFKIVFPCTYNYSIKVSSINGGLVNNITGYCDSQEISLENYSDGIYLISITTDEFSETRKIIKQ